MIFQLSMNQQISISIITLLRLNKIVSFIFLIVYVISDLKFQMVKLNMKYIGNDVAYLKTLVKEPNRKRPDFVELLQPTKTSHKSAIINAINNSSINTNKADESIKIHKSNIKYRI